MYCGRFKRAATTDRDHAGLLAAIEKVGAQRTLHSRLQLEKIEGVPGLEGEFDRFSLSHYHAKLSIFAFDQRTGRRQRSCDSARLAKCDIELRDAADSGAHIVPGINGIAVGVNLHYVITDRQRGEGKRTVIIRRRGTHEGGILPRNNDEGAGYSMTSAIENSPTNFSGVLRPQNERRKNCE